MDEDEKARKLKEAIDLLSSIPSDRDCDRAVGRAASCSAGPSRYQGMTNYMHMTTGGIWVAVVEWGQLVGRNMQQI